MTRFQFKPRSLMDHPGTRAIVSQRTLHALQPIDEPELPQGPGWFDSSWELTHGLEVREGLPGDAQLQAWLDACTHADRRPALRPPTLLGRDPQPRPRLVSAPASAHAALVDAMQFGEFGIDGLELA